MNVWIYSLISVLVLSVISLFGVFIFFFREEKVKKISLFIVSFAVGALFGDVFIHILPEAFSQSEKGFRISILVLLGVFIFFALEKFLRWRHCHVPISTEHYHPVVFMNLVGDAAHNFVDGMLIGASFLVSIPIGLATFVAIVLHEIPQELGDFGMLIHGGMTKQKAIFFNFLSSLAGVVGAIISLVLGSFLESYALIILPLTAGGFLYIAGSDLIPELHHETKISTSIIQLISIILGVGVMVLLLLLK